MRDNVRKSKEEMDKIRELAQQYSISGDGEPIYGSVPANGNNKNYSTYTQHMIDQHDSKYKD